eukprot:scaffold2830_cov131-Cylindrotheca_fusiformis.AAC.96
MPLFLLFQHKSFTRNCYGMDLSDWIIGSLKNVVTSNEATPTTASRQNASRGPHTTHVWSDGSPLGTPVSAHGAESGLLDAMIHEYKSVLHEKLVPQIPTEDEWDLKKLSTRVQRHETELSKHDHLIAKIEEGNIRATDKIHLTKSVAELKEENVGLKVEVTALRAEKMALQGRVEGLENEMAKMKAAFDEFQLD